MDLIGRLKEHAALPSKRGKAYTREYPLWDDPSIKITGWKFNEWDFASDKVVLPVYARGLFTYEDSRIVIRGYDKFFNVDEVTDTRWDNIRAHTQGPYYLTSKENGCIVFMGAVSPQQLVVTSKHSTGPRQPKEGESEPEKDPEEDMATNHSYRGQQWVESHLATVGKTRADLARYLFEHNLTAIGELCDDDFEEHVLSYTNKDAGIYLHGLNHNSAEFLTEPMQAVEAFAAEFGFFKTSYVVKQTVDSVVEFLESCAESGAWQGRDIEGFVVRCKRIDKKNANGQILADFFFKYKFDEPYLMYRHWREVTKSYLSGKPRQQLKLGKHRLATDKYLDFALPYLDGHAEAREAYARGHGIIRLRQLFLTSLQKTGLQLLQETDSEQEQDVVQARKYVLIPVATLGCGKSTLGYALTRLFGWAHVQNDEMTVSSAQKKSALVTAAAQSLQDKPCVLVDRNNHQLRERKQLFDDLGARRSDLVYICLNFVVKTVVHGDALWKETRRRVAARGDNHATIIASEMGENMINGIMKGFVSRFQPVNTRKEPDSRFDMVIQLDGSQPSRKNLQTLVTQLHSTYPDLVPEIPGPQQLDEAISHALQVKPSVSHSRPEPKVNVAYFSLELPGSEPITLIDAFYNAHPDLDQSFWNQLKSPSGGLKSQFHITLCHRNGRSKPEKNMFSALKKRTTQLDPKFKGKASLGVQTTARIVSLAHNAKIMALEVEISGSDIQSTNKHSHITIGMTEGTRPVEANDMLADPASTMYLWDLDEKVLEGLVLHAVCD